MLFLLGATFLNLYFDNTDLSIAEKLKDQRLQWLKEIGAKELHTAHPDDAGFLFSYQHGIAKLEEQVGNRPLIHDRPEERKELATLDRILERLTHAKINVPSPRTWVLALDESPPMDLSFPLFLRTPTSSWKRGGQQSKVHNWQEMEEESELLRRVFGWDVVILAREWLDLAVAGEWRYGQAPQEIRVWVVDRVPFAWSFHYLHVVKEPAGFPPTKDDLQQLRKLASKVAAPFRSRLIATDFAKDTMGRWHFLEAGPGACCGTGHEAVFKAAALRLIGAKIPALGDSVGGLFLTQ